MKIYINTVSLFSLYCLVCFNISLYGYMTIPDKLIQFITMFSMVTTGFWLSIVLVISILKKLNITLEIKD